MEGAQCPIPTKMSTSEGDNSHRRKSQIYTGTGGYWSELVRDGLRKKFFANKFAPTPEFLIIVYCQLNE